MSYILYKESTMENKIRYPIGIQTFSDIIEEGYAYVDKTGHVARLVNKRRNK